MTPQTIAKWRARFVENRLDSLLDAPRLGASRTIDDVRVDAVIAKTLVESVPAGSTHWSTRMMAARSRLVANGSLAHLARLRLLASSAGGLPALQRTAIRREGARHHRAVPRPVAESHIALSGGEEPDPSAGPHAATSAAGPGHPGAAHP